MKHPYLATGLDYQGRHSCHRALPLPAHWPTRGAFGGCDCAAGLDVCSCSRPAEVPAAQPAPAEACTEIGHDDGEPLTRSEALRFWAVTCTPALVGVIGFALLIWCTKP